MSTIAQALKRKGVYLMIKVILLERIERLGTMGQTVSVRPGFARNFLLPQRKALRATKENMEVFEKQRAELEAKNAAQRAAAEAVAKTMEGLELSLIRQASEMGMLFGSVTARDIADVAKESGKAIERQMIQIDTPIKTLGLFPVKVKLHPEVAISIRVNVARSEAEAVAQAEKEREDARADAKAAKAEAELAALEAIGTEAPAEEVKEETAE
jgi:large subunit ribosomal protein L9